MNWLNWLSKTGLEPSVVYEYGLAFSRNELEEEDIAYFDHEFLQSMGISKAKHRLEILKLAWKEKEARLPLSRALVTIKRIKMSLARYIRTWMHRYDSALGLVPRPAGYSSRWRGTMLKRNEKNLLMANSGRLLLTNGSYTSMPVSDPKLDSLSSPMDFNLDKEEKMNGDGYWSTGVEGIRWDTMFQNLKPT